MPEAFGAAREAAGSVPARRKDARAAEGRGDTPAEERWGPSARDVARCGRGNTSAQGARDVQTGRRISIAAGEYAAGGCHSRRFRGRAGFSAPPVCPWARRFLCTASLSVDALVSPNCRSVRGRAGFSAPPVCLWTRRFLRTAGLSVDAPVSPHRRSVRGRAEFSTPPVWTF